MMSLRRNFFKKIYQHITQNEKFSFSYLEQSLIRLGKKLPVHFEDLFEYDELGHKSGVQRTYKRDFDVMRSMVRKEISEIYITLNEIIDVLHLLRI